MELIRKYNDDNSPEWRTSMNILQGFYGLLSTLGFAILFNIQGVTLTYAIINGILSWSVYFLTEGMTPAPYMQHFLTATVIAFYSEFMAIKKKTPATIFLVPAMIPLLPGGLLFYTMQNLFLGKITAALYYGAAALSIAGVVSLSILCVSFSFKLVRSVLHSIYVSRKNM